VCVFFLIVVIFVLRRYSYYVVVFAVLQTVVNNDYDYHVTQIEYTLCLGKVNILSGRRLLW